MNATLNKKQRVRDELLDVGVTQYGIRKSESKALWEHIGDNERVLAAIYGQFESTSAMMVATDMRIMFIDIRALHNIVEDTSYDAFGDLRIDEGMVFSQVTLRTKPREYVFHMVNKKCARRFLNVIENRAMSWDQRYDGKKSKQTATEPVFEPVSATSEQINFLIGNHLATLSTRGENGYPYGATVFYFYDRTTPDDIYSVTKTSTHTALNLERSPKAAFTITNTKSMTTMHVVVDTEPEKESERVNQIIGMLFKHAKHLSDSGRPPVTQIKTGSFKVYRSHIKQITVQQYA